CCETMKMTNSTYRAWFQHEPSKPVGGVSDPITVLGTMTEGIQTASEELSGYVRAVIGPANEDGWQAYGIRAEELSALEPEGYLLRSVEQDRELAVAIVGGTDRGVLYGAYHVLRLLHTGQSTQQLSVIDNPKSQLRLMNQWDNADGSIERGYA